MCGRYASARPVEDIATAFGVGAADVDHVAAPDWNVAPTKPVTAVLTRDGHRVVTTLRWGLVPGWATAPTAPLINARMETVGERAAFRGALAERRCLLPADGWYEWATAPGGGRQPYYLAPPDGALLAFAGLWEAWRDGEGRVLETVTIVTGPAPDDIRTLHDRAPVVVPPGAWARWLGADAADAVTVLRPTPAGVVRAHPVGTAVGDVHASGRGLTEPVDVVEQPTLF
jgi:putative SOS response-associated peptidase YedK